MIEITIKSSIRVKIFVFIQEVRIEEQGTRKEEGMGKHLNNRTLEQFSNGRRKEEAGSANWQRSALPCCCRNEIPLLQLFLMRNLISMKIFVFTLEVRIEKQGTRKEEVEKQWNN